MHYAFIDTNIFIRVMSQGKPGCETELFERLRVLVAGGALTVVIPEVVRLELEKCVGNLSEDLRQSFGKLKEVIAPIEVWSEIEDAKKSVLQQLDSLRDEKILRWERVYRDFSELLNSANVSSIPFTPDIMCRAKKRLIRGGMPKNSRRADQDAAIIESLLVHFSLIQDPQPILFFCSENHSDFAIELPQRESRDRMFALHPAFTKDFPRTHFFTCLEDLLQLDKGYESLPRPLDDEEIQLAMDRADKLSSECHFDLDDEEYMQAVQHLESLINTRFANKYVSEVIPNLPEELRTKREAMVQSIQHLLKQCRQCASWDDKSEMKLSQWIEYIPEDMIPYTSLSNLLKIEKNLQQYLSIHKKMNKDEKNV